MQTTQDIGGYRRYVVKMVDYVSAHLFESLHFRLMGAAATFNDGSSV